MKLTQLAIARFKIKGLQRHLAMFSGSGGGRPRPVDDPQPAVEMLGIC